MRTELATAGVASARSFSSLASVPVVTISRIALAMASPMPANCVRSSSWRTISSRLSDKVADARGGALIGFDFVRIFLLRRQQLGKARQPVGNFGIAQDRRRIRRGGQPAFPWPLLFVVRRRDESVMNRALFLSWIFSIALGSRAERPAQQSLKSLVFISCSMHRTALSSLKIV